MLKPSVAWLTGIILPSLIRCTRCTLEIYHWRRKRWVVLVYSHIILKSIWLSRAPYIWTSSPTYLDLSWTCTIGNTNFKPCRLGRLKFPGNLVVLSWWFQFLYLNNDDMLSGWHFFCQFFRLCWPCGSEAAAVQLCPNVKATIGSTWSWCQYNFMVTEIWIWFYIHIFWNTILLVLKISFENINTILNSEALSRQMVGPIWPIGSSLLTSGLKSRTVDGFFWSLQVRCLLNKLSSVQFTVFKSVLEFKSRHTRIICSLASFLSHRELF